MNAITQHEIDPQVFTLYDEYCHGGIDRREFLIRAAAPGREPALAMAHAMMPRYAQAQTISFTDTRIRPTLRDVPLAGRQLGRDARLPGAADGQWPVPGGARRSTRTAASTPISRTSRAGRAVEGFLALAPDGLYPDGGYPGNDDDGRSAAGEPEPGKAAHGHAEQREIPQGAQALDRQARA